MKVILFHYRFYQLKFSYFTCLAENGFKRLESFFPFKIFRAIIYQFKKGTQLFNFNPQYKTGIIFGIISAMGSALFPIFNKRLVERFSPRILTFYELGGGLIALTLLVPLYLYQFPATYYLPTTSDWLWLLVLAWFCTVLSFDLQLNALKKISAFTANLMYNLEPVYGIILAFIFFKENKELDQHFYIGVGLIFLAVVLQMMRVRKPAPIP